MKMETVEPLKDRKPDVYHFDKSFDDGDGCIHLPVTMTRRPGVPDISIDIDAIELDIVKKYPNLVFTKQWSTSSGDNGIKEYLFFYEKPKDRC